MTNAQRLARDCALDVLKAYNSKIFSLVATPEQRERAQAAAMVAAERHIRLAADNTDDTLSHWLDEPSEES